MNKLIFLIFSLIPLTVFSQEPEPYNIRVIKEAGCTPVKDQKNSGMCWAYSAAFLEEEGYADVSLPATAQE